MKKHILILLSTLLTGAFLTAQNAEIPKVKVLFTYNNLVKDYLIQYEFNDWHPPPTNPYIPSDDEIQDFMMTKVISEITSSNLVLENSEINTFRWDIADVVKIPFDIPLHESLEEESAFTRNNQPLKEFLLNTAGTTGADQLFSYTSMDTGLAGGIAGTLTLEYPISYAKVFFDYTTTAHEMGHNLQANHSRDVPDTFTGYNRGPEAYNFGYNLTGTNRIKSDVFINTTLPQEEYSVGTIMSYGNYLPYFSNPNLQITATAFKLDETIHWQPTGTYTYPLGVPQGVADAPDAMTTGSFGGAADNARVLRQTGPILAAMHGEMAAPQIVSSTISYKPGSYTNSEGSYGPGYLEAIVVASGENLTATWNQGGSHKTARTDDHTDLYTSYSVYHQPYDWSPNASYPGIPGQDTFTFRSNTTTQPVQVTISNPLDSITLTLPDQEQTLTITLNPDSSETETTTITRAPLQAYGTLPSPTKTGHTFTGWYNGAVKITATTVVPLGQSDHSLTAHWQGNSHTVTFNSNGGTPTTASMTVTYGQNYGTLPTPTRTGYTFSGWTQPNGNSVSALTLVSIDADHTLTAQWQAKVLTVIFHGNGGTPTTTSKTVTYGQNYGTLPTATRSGYTFSGWTQPNGNGASALTLVSIDTNHTLTAQWTPSNTGGGDNTGGGGGGGGGAPSIPLMTFMILTGLAKLLIRRKNA